MHSVFFVLIIISTFNFQHFTKQGINKKKWINLMCICSKILQHTLLNYMTELIFEMKKIFLNKKVRSKIIVLIQSISEKKKEAHFI